MKNPLLDAYEQIILGESAKADLENPSNDTVGNLKNKQDLFGSKPKPVDGPDKAKLKEGPSYKLTAGSAPKAAKASKGFKGTAAAETTEAEEPEELEGEEVTPETEEEAENSKKTVTKENYSMSAFENLFKKTLMSEEDETLDGDLDTTGAEDVDDVDLSDVEEDDADLEHEADEAEEETDLIADLHELQDKLASILAKLEDTASDEEVEEGDDEGYSDEEFDAEFAGGDDEEAPVKESLDKPKHLADAKGKGLTKKKNTVGKLKASGGKAKSDTTKADAKLKALGDKKAHLQKHSNQVKSSVKKGEFFK